MNKFLSFGLLLFLPILSGCDSESWEMLLRQAQNAPAQVALDTISKLVTAESVFRQENNQYTYDTESLNKLFVQNEYEILTEDHQFFYCYDSAPKELLGTKVPGNFLVLAVDPSGKVLAKGSSVFRNKIQSLNELSSSPKEAFEFETVLEIENGHCFEILPLFDQEESSPKDQLSLEEVRNLMKELQNLSDKEREALNRKVNDFIELLTPIQTVPQWQKPQQTTPPIFRLQLKKDQPHPKLLTK